MSVRFVLLGLLLLWLTACQQSDSEVSADPLLITAEAVPGTDLVVPVQGRVEDPRPKAYTPPLPWLAIESLEKDGSPVDAEQRVIGLSLEMLDLWIADRQLRIDIARAQQAFEVWRTGMDQAALEDRSDKLRADIAVKEAIVAATRKRDAEQIRIAAWNLKQSEAKLALRRKRLADLRERLNDGLATMKEVIDETEAVARAEQGVRVPAVRLDILQSSTDSVRRYRTQLELAKLQADLGVDDGTAQDGGIVHQVQVLQRKLASRERQAQVRVQRDVKNLNKQHTVRQDPFLTVEKQGVLAYPSSGLAIGQRLKPTAALFVIGDRITGCRFTVPDRLREFIHIWEAEHPERGRILVDIPALGHRGVAGRIRSLITVDAQEGNQTQRRNICEAELDTELSDLRDGMKSTVRLLVPIGSGSSLIPAWALVNEREPAVLLADGSQRALQGRLIGEHFLVQEGLQPGQQIRLPMQRETGEHTRYVGYIESTQQVSIETRPWRMQLLSMADDGAVVEEGDIVATLAPTDGKTAEDLQAQIEDTRLAAEQERELKEIEADLAVGRALTAWRKSVLDHRRAAFDHLVERYAGIDEAVTRAEVGLANAGLDVAKAERKLADVLDPSRRAQVSDQQRRIARLDLAKAKLRKQKSQLDLVAARRTISWEAVERAAVAERSAQENSASKRRELALARARMRSDKERAQNRYRRSLRRVRREMRTYQNLTLTAPISGRVYRNSNMWEPLRIGERVRVKYPFFIPVGEERVLKVDLPATRFGAVKAGDELAVRIPALGVTAVPGTVTAVTEHFRLPDGVVDEIMIRGSAGMPTKIFTVSVRLQVDLAQAARLLPGTMAWIEL